MPEGPGWKARLIRFLRGDSLPVRARDEEALLEEVERDLRNADARRPLSRESLRSLASARGADYAAAWYFTRVLRERPAPRGARERVERVLIVPGAFYRTLPEYNTDGQMGFEAARRFGVPVERAELPEFGTVEDCAEHLREKLMSLPPHGTLIVSISKGTADLKLALHRYPELRSRISALISIGGIPRGTFATDESIARGWLARLLLGFTAWIHGGSLETVRSLRAGPGSLLAALPERLELDFPVTCIVPVPLHSHVTTFLRRRFVGLQKYGPNDGMCLLADSIIPGARAIPVWGADHFFQVPGFSRHLLEALREYLSPLLSESLVDDSSLHPPAPRPG